MKEEIKKKIIIPIKFINNSEVRISKDFDR